MPSARLERVVTHLRDLIASEGLTPGSKLPSETSLSKALGVSRPIVREALRSLAATGLIEMAVGKRAVVVEMDGEMLSRVIEDAVRTGQADPRNVLELRRGLEMGMVCLAAERRSDEDVGDLRAILADMDTCLNDGDAYAALDMRLHLTLARAARNPLYTLMIEALRQAVATSMLVGIKKWAATPELARVQELHEAIVDAVAAGDPAAAAAAMAQHFDDAIAAILAEPTAERVSRG